MAEHNELGKAGENAAVAYLEEHGYLIRHRNWRKGHFELDIVAAKENELVIVEVKTRSNILSSTFITSDTSSNGNDSVTPFLLKQYSLIVSTFISLSILCFCS